MTTNKAKTDKKPKANKPIPRMVLLLLGHEARYATISEDGMTVTARHGAVYRRASGLPLDAPVDSYDELCRVKDSGTKAEPARGRVDSINYHYNHGRLPRLRG